MGKRRRGVVLGVLLDVIRTRGEDSFGSAILSGKRQ